MRQIAVEIVLDNLDINRLKENISSAIVQYRKVYFVDNSSRNVDAVRELLKKFNRKKSTFTAM